MTNTISVPDKCFTPHLFFHLQATIVTLNGDPTLWFF